MAADTRGRGGREEVIVIVVVDLASLRDRDGERASPDFVIVDRLSDFVIDHEHPSRSALH
jgi:hypothetical protein